MRVLFVLRSVELFSYHETTIRRLCRNGHEVEVLSDKAASVGASDLAARACAAETPGLTLGWGVSRRDVFRRPLFASRELLSYASYLGRDDQDEFYLKRWERYLPRLVQGIMSSSTAARSMVGSGVATSALRAFGRVVPIYTDILEALRARSPDVLVASPANLRSSEEVEYLRAARRLGIPTVVSVLSWDNLTTKGLLHAVPDLTLVWNQSQLEEAVSIHGIQRDGVVITGSPFLDKWFEEPVDRLDQGAFRARVGLGPHDPFVLYLGSSANIARDETWLVTRLAERLRSSPDERVRRTVVLARPHGANQEVYRSISAPNLRVWLRDDALPDSPATFAEFAAALRCSVCSVGLNTTAMVDAVLADRPVITLLVPEYRDSNASRAVHFRQLLDADIYMRAESAEQCASLVAEVLDGADPTAQMRRRFALEHVRPRGLDRPAGDVAATAIEMAARRRTAAEIDEALTPGAVEQKAAVQ